MPRSSRIPEARPALCASLRGRNACQHFRKATFYGNLQVKCCRPEPIQNADTHFVRACAVEMHVKCHKSQFRLYTEIYRRNAAAQLEHPHFASACAVEMQVNIPQEPFLFRYRRKMPRPSRMPEARHTLCASLRSRNACQHFREAIFYRNLQVKCCRPEPTQNADTHFVRACAAEMHVKCHKSNFKYRKLPRPSWSTLIKHRPLQLP